MKVTVMRLKNAPQGQPYVIEQMENLTPEQAGQLSVGWWESRGTLAMVLLADGREDSRYVREYVDEERVPDSWPRGTVAPVVEPSPIKLPPAPSRPQPPREPPTVVNPPQQADAKQRPKCPTCARFLPSPQAEQARRGEVPAGSACVTCGQAYTCGTCLKVLPANRKYEGDSDPTPSGRLANLRCPECGSPQQGMSGRDLWKMYTRRS